MKNVILIILLLFPIITKSQSEERIALVIGNGRYQYGNSLKNPENDAELMTRILQKLEFQVTKKINATRKEMNEAIIEFSKKAKTSDIALFYYAGHGIQVDGINYIIPIDSKINDPVAVQFEAIKVDNIVTQFEYYENHQNIVILDACRENPFLSWVRGGMNSLAPASAPRGTIIAFATGNGSVSYDNIEASNGLYTGILAKELLIPQRIEDVFINTRNKVFKASNGKQQPQEWSQLSGVLFLTKEIRTLDPENKIEFKNGKVVIVPIFDGQLYMDNKLIGMVSAGKDFSIDKSVKGLRKFEIKGQKYWCDSLYIDDKLLENQKEPKLLDEKNSFSNSDSGEFIDTQDSLKYKWVKIGKQIWMAENCKKYLNDEQSFCRNYDKNNLDKMGMLYTWEGAQKACPVGWHLPSKEEYDTLFNYLGDNDELGSKLKSNLTEKDTEIYWDNQSSIKTTNSSGFSALPIGVAHYRDIFLIQRSSAHFWTSSSYGKDNATLIAIWSHQNNIGLDIWSKTSALSVRCVKNKTANTN